MVIKKFYPAEKTVSHSNECDPGEDVSEETFWLYLRPAPQEETHGQHFKYAENPCCGAHRSWGESIILLSDMKSNSPLNLCLCTHQVMRRSDLMVNTETGQSAEEKCQWSAQPQMGHLYHSPLPNKKRCGRKVVRDGVREQNCVLWA